MFQRVITDKSIGLVLCLAVFFVILYLRNAGMLQGLDLAGYDFALKKTPRLSSSQDIVLVKVTEADIKRYKQWPLSDGLLNQLLVAMLAERPVAIGVDIYRDRLIAPGSEQLETTIRENPNILLVEKFAVDHQQQIRPHPQLSTVDNVGFSDLLMDTDGIVRRGLLYLDDGDHFSTAFSLKLAMHYLSQKGVQASADKSNPQLLRLGKTTFVPIDKGEGGYVGLDSAGYQFLLNYPIKHQGYAQVSIQTVLSGQFEKGFFTDKIVILGVDSQTVKDNFTTPLDKGVLDAEPIPGVVIHAQIAQQILHAALYGRAPMRGLSHAMEVLWILAWSLFGMLLSFAMSSLTRYLLMLASGVLIIIGASYWTFVSGIWLPYASTLMAFLDSSLLVTGYIFVKVKRDRKQVMELFSRHVSPQVAEEIWTHRNEYVNDGRLKARQVTATILFSDLEGFTPVAERLSAEQLMDWLNQYMDVMAGTLIEHGAMIDDYYGDAIKANFGVPIARTEREKIAQDALNAAQCAIEMGKQLTDLNRFWESQGAPQVRMRIGIATGSVVAGCLGSTQRLKYTTVGDVVNIAARLESFNLPEQDQPMDFPCRILVAEDTARLLSGYFRFKHAGQLQLKGKEQKVNAFQLLLESE
ncbi:MAG: adenylate/guanylate cyclase domain-containing protein [Gammaproteobacteria bacterium]|nr:adenylate/guanylate cyclase domain-containing protein [Gammaproteobacteria bacterium]